MIILAVDDEKHALEVLEDAIEVCMPDAEVFGFSSGSAALEFAKSRACDVAFLDIRLRDMSGLMLAKALKDSCPNTNIIFVTAYSEYAMEAYTLYPSGYLLKPVTPEGIRKELDNLRFPVQEETGTRIRLRCFGNFEVFAENEPIHFKRSKTKELLAYLTDRQGAWCTMGELLGVLWEDKPDSISLKSNLRSLIHDLRTTMAEAGAEYIILKTRNEIALCTDKVECDYYDFLCCEPGAVNRYMGEYMMQYSWAEMTTAMLRNSQIRQKSHRGKKVRKKC